MAGFLLALVLDTQAAEPPPITPAPTATGTWRTELLVPAPVDTVRAALADPIASARFSPDIETITNLTRGACDTFRVKTQSFIPVAYDYRRCPTADGWHETLVTSESLSAYEVVWRLSPVEGGTKVSYEVKIEPVFPAPEIMLSRAMKSSIATYLGRLYRSVTG